ncbi:MAG TPA: hypothetical protein VD788_13385 [Candidatus Polarisedimenticolaceae bacterium]|nr:hypothetical protein [Candidatus Polarisedimenticolaceae bacterium]
MQSRDGNDPRHEPRQTSLVADPLRPQLERLGLGAADGGPPPEVPEEVRFGDQTLRIDGWERMVMRAHGLGTDGRGRPWPALVSRAVAFRARAFELAARRPPADTSTGRAGSIERLRDDHALAGALLGELEWTQRRLRDEGEDRLATRFTELIDRVDRIARQLGVLLGDGAVAALPRDVGVSLDPTYRDRWPIPRREAGPVDSHRPSPDRSERLRLKLRVGRLPAIAIVLVAVAVSVVAWLWPVGPRSSGQSAAGLGPMFQRPAVVDAVAEAGLVTVTVDGVVWDGLSVERRESETATLTEIARTAGYGSIRLRTADGAVIAVP